MYFLGDYDECSYSPSVCRSDELCQNYPGTYRCYCSSPRALNINNVCTSKSLNHSIWVRFMNIQNKTYIKLCLDNKNSVHDALFSPSCFLNWLRILLRRPFPDSNKGLKMRVLFFRRDYFSSWCYNSQHQFHWWIDESKFFAFPSTCWRFTTPGRRG